MQLSVLTNSPPTLTPLNPNVMATGDSLHEGEMEMVVFQVWVLGRWWYNICQKLRVQNESIETTALFLEWEATI